MKRFCILIMILLTCLCACQPTPSAPIVQSKNDGKLQKRIAASALPEKRYEAISEWTEQISIPNENVTINVNAKIDVPDVASYPVYRVSDADISDDNLNGILDYMIGAKPIYTWDNEAEEAVSTEILKRRIAAAEYQLYDQNSLYHKYVIGKNSEYTSKEHGAGRECASLYSFVKQRKTKSFAWQYLERT